jgi:Kef-type K+ transport system membrane component KefB
MDEKERLEKIKALEDIIAFVKKNRDERSISDIVFFFGLPVFVSLVYFAAFLLGHYFPTSNSFSFGLIASVSATVIIMRVVSYER